MRAGLPREDTDPTDPPDPPEPPPPPPPTDPPPPPPVSVTAEMIARFAPQVRLHPDDPFRPASVPWFLPRVQMKMDLRGGLFGTSDELLLRPGQVTPQNIAAQSFRGQQSGAGYPSDFYLQIEGGDEGATRRGDLGSAVCYVHTLENVDGAGSTDIQYWFFYPYNGDITGRGRAGIAILLTILNPILGAWAAAAAIATRVEHEGDWEHVTVRVGRDGQPRRAYYSAHHGEGGWHEWGTLARAGTHPIVYCARHSHASYIRPGEQNRPELADYVAPDFTAEGGPVWNTETRWEWVNQTNPPWLAYSGLWGQTSFLDVMAGPRAPALQSAWNGEDVGPSNEMTFYEDNRCGGDQVGHTTDAPGQSINLTNRPGWTNDEARSVKLHTVRAGTVITVYDDSDGKLDNDWTRIIVKRDCNYCIGTFEQQYDDNSVRILHHHVDNLDGKVSRITIDRWENMARPWVAVRYGATIKLLHHATASALHSHLYNYTHSGSSLQQQVTGFAGGDDNDLWIVKGPHGQPENYRAGQVVRGGDIVRLEHVPTRRNLHSHSGHPSPVTRQQEVTCFGENGLGDDNDNWRVEIEGEDVWHGGNRLRLIHVNTNHALHSHSVRYVQQQEVTGFGSRDDNDWWTLLEVRDQPYSNSAFVSQSVPATMEARRTYAVSVTLRNTGATVWTPGGPNPYALGSQWPQDNNRWGLGRVGLPGDVPPGAEATFRFNVTAPSASGVHNFQWRMVQEWVEWFGAYTPNVPVNVVVPVYTLAATPGTLSLGGSFVVRWTAPAGRPATDWIGFYKVGAPNSPSLWWQYTGGAASGSFTVPAPTQPGQYEFRYLLEDGYTSVAASNPVGLSVDIEALRAAVRQRAYQIWVSRGREPGNAWSHWFAARSELGVPPDLRL